MQLLLATVGDNPAVLSDTALVTGLVAAAGVLEPAAAGPALQGLVSRCMALNPVSCISLISSVSSKPALQLQLVPSVAAWRWTLCCHLLWQCLACLQCSSRSFRSWWQQLKLTAHQPRWQTQQLPRCASLNTCQSCTRCCCLRWLELSLLPRGLSSA